MLEINFFGEFEQSIGEEKHNICEGWGGGCVCKRRMIYVSNSGEVAGLNDRGVWRLGRMQRIRFRTTLKFPTATNQVTVDQ